MGRRNMTLPNGPTLGTATLGGGCFWCLEAVFQELDGTVSVIPGYAGGWLPNPSYEDVCTGRTGHAEVVQVTYDTARLSFADLLDVFFAAHDPTTPDRQGNDVGPQYRSIVLYHSEEQRKTTIDYIRELHNRGVFDRPIVTEVVPLEAFYPAEAYHRDYYQRHPTQPYCALVISPKVAKIRKTFAARLKRRSG
jgi:peptide-methionine (S)-S-oxide reductase